jgi:hypothetical protein
MAMGQLIRVTTEAANRRPERSVHYVVAEHDFEKAAAILMSVIPAGAKVESAGNVAASLLTRLKLAPGQFIEV